MDGIGIPSQQRDQELSLWELERQANVRLLTPAEVTKAVKDGFMSTPDGSAYLQNLGFSESDATLRLEL